MGDSVYVGSVMTILANQSKKAFYAEEEITYMKSIWLPHNGHLFTTMYKSYGFDFDNIQQIVDTPNDFRGDQNADFFVDYYPTIYELNSGGLGSYVPTMMQNQTYWQGYATECSCTTGNNTQCRTLNNQCQLFGCKVGFYKVKDYQGF